VSTSWDEELLPVYGRETARSTEEETFGYDAAGVGRQSLCYLRGVSVGERILNM
jgi:hypothetical protein